jgi:hypothetical protein
MTLEAEHEVRCSGQLHAIERSSRSVVRAFHRASGQEFTMLDFIFAVSIVLCFAVSLLYVRACDRLKGRPSVD